LALRFHYQIKYHIAYRL